MKHQFIFNTFIFAVLFAIVITAIALSVRTMVRFAAEMPNFKPALTQTVERVSAIVPNQR
jgi:hypothetical protein